jgi:hypothetical protein
MSSLPIEGTGYPEHIEIHIVQPQSPIDPFTFSYVFWKMILLNDCRFQLSDPRQALSLVIRCALASNWHHIPAGKIPRLPPCRHVRQTQQYRPRDIFHSMALGAAM